MAVDTTYFKKADESIAEYNARIAAYNASKQSPTNPTPASGDVNTVYFKKADESIDEYNERIAEYRAGTTSPSIATKSSGGSKVTPQIDFNPEDAADRINKLSSAMNVAIDEARLNRKDSTLDFLGGVIPPGALPATSFAGVLNAFNTDSRPLESTLAGGALDFAQEQERNKLQQQASLQELALSVVEAGGDQATIDAILASSNINDAISATAAALGSLTKDDTDIRQVGSNLISVDGDGNVKVLFSASSGGGSTGGSGGDTPTTTTPPGGIDFTGGFNPISAKASDLKEQVRKTFAPEVANKIITELTDEQLRLFMQDFIDFQNQTQQSMADPLSFYEEWKNALGINKKESGGGSSIANPFGS